MTNPNPLADLVAIRGNLTKVVKPHGLQIDHYLVVPGATAEGPHRVMVIMHIGGEQPDSMDLQFNEIVKNEEDAKRKEHRAEQFNSFTDDLDEIDEDLSGGGLL